MLAEGSIKEIIMGIDFDKAAYVVNKQCAFQI